jgi:Leucine-rich repeat (LRR) protein
MNKVKRKLKEWSIDSKTVELDMSYSELKKIPGVIRKLKNLTKLHLNGNNIK